MKRAKVKASSRLKGLSAVYRSVIMEPLEKRLLQSSTGSAVPVGLTPEQIRQAYGVDGIVGDGTGQTIAIIDAYGSPRVAQDLGAFDASFGLRDATILNQFNQEGGSDLPVPADPTDPTVMNWSTETCMDVEWASVMAPGATIDLFAANSESPSDLDAAVTTAETEPNVSIVSMSYGWYETSSEVDRDAVFTTPASAAGGITFVAASGDSGASSTKGALYPAFSPNVLAVGGTELTVNTLANGQYSYGSETAWNLSGGGVSQYEPQPSYQQGITDSVANGMRTVPDVSMVGGTGVALYDSSVYGVDTPWAPTGGDGTSLSTPLWAGLIAVTDQLRASEGLPSLDGPSGTLPRLYSLPSSDFHDITSGSNGEYTAGPGYDLVTGLGSPVANKLVPDLAGGDTVTGRVFQDMNDNGAYDTGDVPLSGQTVYLDLNNSGEETPDDPTAITDATGTYTFDNSTDLVGGQTIAVRVADLGSGYVALPSSNSSDTFVSGYDTAHTVNLGFRSTTSVAVAATIPNSATTVGASGGLLDLNSDFNEMQAPNDIVDFDTSLGSIYVQLTPSATPQTVANFLSYMSSGAYNGTIIHRSVLLDGSGLPSADSPADLIQGGGYKLTNLGLQPIPVNDPVQDEFDTEEYGDVAGTLAMAKSSYADSATSQWFFNEHDNTELDDLTTDPNGDLTAYTVFGTVLSGMNVVDAIARLPVYNIDNADLSDVPVTGMTQTQADAGASLNTDNLVLVNSVISPSGPTYTVTSDNSAVVSASVNGSVLSYDPITAGTAHLTVLATGPDGSTASETFTVTVAQPVLLGAGGNKSITFTDSNGTVSTVSLHGPGLATVNLLGSRLTLQTTKGRVSVVGAVTGIGNIEIAGSTLGTGLTIVSRGVQGTVDLSGVTSTGPLGALSARDANLTGATTIVGFIRSLVVASTAASSSITAASSGTIQILGDSAGTITLTGPVSRIRIGGTLTGSLTASSVGSLMASSIDNDTIGLTGGGTSLASLLTNTLSDTTLLAAGNIGNISVATNISGSTLYAGISPDTLNPNPTMAVGAGGQINLIRVGFDGEAAIDLSQTAIAAQYIRLASLGTVSDASSTVPFDGIAAGDFNDLRAQFSELPFRIRAVSSESLLTIQLEMAGIKFSNFQVEIV